MQEGFKNYERKSRKVVSVRENCENKQLIVYQFLISLSCQIHECIRSVMTTVICSLI